MNETQKNEMNKLFIFSTDYLNFMNNAKSLNITDNEKTDFYIKASGSQIGDFMSRKDLIMIKQGVTNYKINATTLI